MLNANGCKRIACITIDKKKENRQQNHKDTIRYSAKILVHTLQNKTYFHQKEYAPRYMKVMCMLISSVGKFNSDNIFFKRTRIYFDNFFWRWSRIYFKNISFAGDQRRESDHWRLGRFGQVLRVHWGNYPKDRTKLIEEVFKHTAGVCLWWCMVACSYHSFKVVLGAAM